MNDLILTKNMIRSELTPGEIILLKIIYDENKELFKHFCLEYSSFISNILDNLEKKLYLKNTGDTFEELILRQKSLDLFENNEEITFDIFWENYHKETNISKTDKEPAKKHWKRLTKSEQKKAIDLDIIKGYVNYVINNQGGYFKKARTYLADKNFNDDYSEWNKEERVNRM